MTGPADGWAWDVTPISAPRLPSIPGYRLTEPLGAGGHARVYRAVDGAGRTVAVKVVPRAALSERAHARFVREGELLARLRHPNVVTVHAWGETAEVCYLVSELIDGQHLDAAARALDLERRLDLVEQTARGVAALHALGLVHRDLKPANVLVDADGRVRLIDLGVSGGEGLERLTQTGQFMGTPLYAAPERLSAADGADAPRGDVWALGAIAYEVLTERHPYPAETAADLSRRAHGRPPSPRALRRDVSRAVSAVVRRALSPRPARRHADAAAFAAALTSARRRRMSRLVPAAAAAGVALSIALAAWPTRRPTGPRPAAPAPPVTVVAASTTATTATTATLAPTALGAAALRAPAGALASAGRWSDLAALLAGRADLAPDLRRLRGLAALFAGPDPPRPADLAHDDPVHVLERRRRALVTSTLARVDDASGPPSAADDAIAASLDHAAAARAAPAGDPGAAEVTRRHALHVRDLLLRLGRRPDLARRLDLEQVRRLVAEVGAQAGVAEARALAVVGAWVELAHAMNAQGRDPRQVIASVGAALPPDAGAGQPPEVEGLALALRLAAGAPAAPPLEVGTIALGPLLLLGAPGNHLRNLALRALGPLDHDAAVAAFRRGDAARGDAHLSRALDALRAIEEGAAAAPQPQLWTSLLLMDGDVERARVIIGFMDATPARRLLLVECDLIAGQLKGAASRLELAIGNKRFHGWAARLDLHRRVLARELTAAEALAQLPPDGDVTPDQRGLPWHTEAGLREVLQGGWWPGEAAAAERRRRRQLLRQQQRQQEQQQRE